jgi:hypothetical protein
MQASKRLVNEWARLKAYGDVKAIAEQTKTDQATISRVMAGKQNATIELLLAIKEYYSKRKDALKKLQA